MSILYCQRTIFPNFSAHAIHTGTTAANFALAGVPTSIFPALPLVNGKQILASFYEQIGFSPLPEKLRVHAIPIRQKGLFSILFRLRLAQAMRAQCKSVCFASSVKEAVMALDMRAYCGRKNDVRVVFEIHHLISRLKQGAQAEKLHALERRAFTDCDLVVFNCDALRAQTQGYLPQPQREFIAPLGYNERVIKAVSMGEKDNSGEVGGKIRLAYVGSFQAGKGVDILLAALARLPSRYSLKIVGGRPAEALQTLRESCKKLSLEHRVEFTGQVAQNEVGQQLAGTDIFVIPLQTDSDFLAPIKMFEAVGFALPIAATPMPSLLEQLKEGENAVFASALDAEALAEAILKLGENPGLRRALHENNRELGARLSSKARAQTLLKEFGELFGPDFISPAQ